MPPKVWNCSMGRCLQNELDKIESIQKRVLKIILRKPKLFPTEKLYQEADVLKPTETYHNVILQLTHKNRHTIRQQNFTYETRLAQSAPLRQHRPNFTQSERTAVFLGPRLYNSLPLDIRNIHSPALFKKKIRPLLQTLNVS